MDHVSTLETSRSGNREAIRRAARIVAVDHDRVMQIWEQRGVWLTNIRWVAGPLLVLAALVGRRLGFEFRLVPVLVIAAAILTYNAAILLGSRREDGVLRPGRTLTIVGMIGDYVTLLGLLHLTGGVSSPLIVFVIFNVMIAAMQFQPRIANMLAVAASAGLWMLLLGQVQGWWLPSEVTFRGEPLHAVDRPHYLAIVLLLLTITLFVTAAIASRIMRRFRERVGDLAEVTTELGAANDKLRSLYTMVRTIGAERRLQPVLDTVVSELAGVMGVPAVAIKLLEEDGRTLRFTASHGLPLEMTDAVFDLESSPIHRRVFDGETVVRTRIGEGEAPEVENGLNGHGIDSVILAPLRLENRVIGVLSVYSNASSHFEHETEFIELTAGLVATAIEDARANEAVERLVKDRTEFTLQVAHNLRAPVGASLSVLDLVRGGYLGPVTEKQKSSLERVETRLSSLNKLIGELLTIGKARDWTREITDVVVDLNRLASQTEELFREEAASKNVRYRVIAPAELPPVESGANLLEQVMQNLVSNAIKYTPEGGEVEVTFARADSEEVRITVRDTGIGIPEEEQPKLFREFFRASNAKQMTTEGTGLGLALVKKTVERHHGRVDLESEVGRGTTVTIALPIHQPAQ